MDQENQQIVKEATDDSDESTEFEMCEYMVGASLSEQSDGSLDVDEEGHKCVNEAVAKVAMETHAGPSMEFWVCEDHLKTEREAGNVDEVLKWIDD